MPPKAPTAKHLRRLSKPWGEVRLADLREHGVWTVDMKKKDGLWICPLVSEPPLSRFFCDYFSPVLVRAVFGFADGTYPRGLVSPMEDADDLDLDPAVFGVDGSLVNLVVRTRDDVGIAEACSRLGRTMEQIMPLRVAATVECGRKVVCERRIPGFPVGTWDGSVPWWMRDGLKYVRE